MGDDAIKIDAQQFWERLTKLHKEWMVRACLPSCAGPAHRNRAGLCCAAHRARAWPLPSRPPLIVPERMRPPAQKARDPEGPYKGADALVIDTGGNNEEELYSKSKALQTWLLGYEFTETVILVCSRSVHVLTSKKKVSHLEPLKSAENATLPLELLTRDKTDGNKAHYATLVGALRSSHAGKIIATLGKEKPLGDFAAGWRAALDASELEKVELAPALAELLAVKDASEASCTKRAAIFSAMLMKNYLQTELEDVVDKETKISHETLAQKVEDAFADPVKVGVKLNAELLEPCYTPIIQSGGEFDLKPSASSNEKNLYYGVITCSLGARYKSYCANVGRTYVINPSKGMEKHYKLLLEVQQEAINALRSGATLSAAYEAAMNRLKSKAAHLEKKMTKNVGFATGIEFREGSLQLNGKNESRVRSGMVFNVAVGIEGLEDKAATDKRSQTYALFVADTVQVTESGPPVVLTDKSLKQWGDISYSLNDDEETAGVKVNTGRRGEVEVLETRTRNAGKGTSNIMETSEALATHQADLEESMRVEALERLRKEGGGGGGPSGPVETPIAYRDANTYPTQSATGGPLLTNKTFVDSKAETVLIPIFGNLVPFHISTIKNVSKNDEGGITFLRINFVAPAASAAGTTMTGMPKESKPDDHFIREITLKSRVPTNLNHTFMRIKELRKRVQTREKQEALEADLVTQAALQLIKAGKVHRLRDCYVRPNVGGKKSSGTLELHVNGLRFTTGRGERLDLIFKNIKLALFQAAEKEIIVLLHFHLHNPIMIGKKKTKDVQFYVEVMEASYALDSAKRSGYDPDELEEEQRERQLRNKMNKEFQNFARLVEQQTGGDLEFDVPYRDLGFYGVPPHNKATCYVMPAVHALVELTEPPWFVVPLNDIEVAHFERVVYGLKNFDITLVMKDFSIKPVQISAINVEHLESLKTWLDTCNIKFYEGTANLNWGQIMKHITNMGLQEFYDEGGWKNVLGLDDESGEEGAEDSEDAESDYQDSGEDESEEESDSDEYADEVDSEDESEGEESLDSDESEGKDFDELEEEAQESDKKRGSFEYEEEQERPSKKSKGGSKEHKSSKSSKPSKSSTKGVPPPKVRR